MLRDFRLYLDDILEAIHQIRTYLADQDEEAFKKDRKTQDAIIRNLEIIGEAAGKLPEQMQKDVSRAPLSAIRPVSPLPDRLETLLLRSRINALTLLI